MPKIALGWGLNGIRRYGSGLLSSLVNTRRGAAKRGLVFVSGSDSSHFKSLMQFLRSVTRNETDSVVYVWDLGLSEDEARQVRTTFPEAQYRIFPFDEYPSYFDIRKDAGQYAWKPVAISLVAEELIDGDCGPLLLWCDAGNIVLRRLKWVRRYIAAEGMFSPFSLRTLRHWTHPSTVSFFGFSARELERRNANGALVGFDLSSSKGRDIVFRWATLAQDRAVIAPEGSDRSNHRQDQALLSCLLVQAAYPDYAYRAKWNPEYKLQWDID